MKTVAKKLIVQKSISNVEISCPSCFADVSNIEYVFSENGYDYPIYFCPECTFLFVRPLPIENLDERQMDSLGDAEFYDSKLMKFLHRKVYVNKEIKKIKKLTGESPLLLDVGCGTGWISSHWQKAGFKVVGLEPSLRRGNYAKSKYGIDVVNDYVETAEFDNQFDVAILRHVVEHFQEPVDVLQKIRETLAPQGVLLIIVPNIDCFGRMLFGVDWEWVLPWHCNFFNPKSLVAMVENAGFEVQEIYKTASPLYYGGSLARKVGSPRLARIMGRHRVPVMMASIPPALFGLMVNLGDNLNIIVRKQE